MSLIVGKKDIRSQFEKAWMTLYVPGLLLYAERSKLKSLSGIYDKVVQSGMWSFYLTTVHCNTVTVYTCSVIVHCRLFIHHR